MKKNQTLPMKTQTEEEPMKCSKGKPQRTSVGGSLFTLEDTHNMEKQHYEGRYMPICCNCNKPKTPCGVFVKLSPWF